MSLATQHERLILDNPNVTVAVLSRLIGVDRNQIERFRSKRKVIVNWVYRGYGFPFMKPAKAGDGICYQVCSGRKLFSGRLDKAIEMVDRLIFCLDNNNGKLPPTMNEYVFGNLKFGGDNA